VDSVTRPCRISEPPSGSARVSAIRKTRSCSRRRPPVIHRLIEQRPTPLVIHSHRSVARFGRIDRRSQGYRCALQSDRPTHPGNDFAARWSPIRLSSSARERFRGGDYPAPGRRLTKRSRAGPRRRVVNRAKTPPTASRTRRPARLQRGPDVAPRGELTSARRESGFASGREWLGPSRLWVRARREARPPKAIPGPLGAARDFRRNLAWSGDRTCRGGGESRGGDSAIPGGETGPSRNGCN
jgi:hypothetical protein